MPEPSAKLQELLTTFLAEYRESDGGLAQPTGPDLEVLYALLDRLVDEKFAGDPDGDRPLVIHVVNRVTHEAMHFRPLPQTRMAVLPLAKRLEIVQLAHLNCQLAQRQLDLQLQFLGQDERERQLKRSRR